MDANRIVLRRGRALITVLWLLVLWPTPSRAAAQADTAAGQPPPRADIQSMVDELKKLVTEQRALIDGQAERIGALERDLASVKRQQSTDPIPTPAPPPPQVDPTAQRQPEMHREVVAAGEFPRSIGIPGTDAAIRFTGQARMTAVQTLGPLGTDDRFVTSSIPVGDDQEAGEDARTVYSPSASRFGLDLRTPFQKTTLRTFIEGDFAGNNNTFRLRHAFMQTSRWIIGQTWSTFSDPEAEPIGIDFEGLNAISLFRQAQIRYTYPLRPQLQLAVALENPAPDLTGASGVNLTPDLIARLRWEPASAVTGPLRLSGAQHVQAAIIGRQLRGELTDQPQATLSTAGFGVNVSGELVPFWDRDDRVKFASNNGWGIGKYITDLGTLGGQDAIYDSSAGTLRALPVASGYVGYERNWRPTFVSAFTYGIVNVANLDIQPGEALKRTQRTSINLTWSPVPQADIALEFLFGTRINKNDERGTSSQIQLGWIYRF
jgi:uncharacterized coiled-coil protein SlyX